MDLNYSLIGSYPQVEIYRGRLPALINAWKTGRDRAVNGVLISMCAEHFYGLDPLNFEHVSDLIDAIEGMEQDLAVH